MNLDRMMPRLTIVASLLVASAAPAAAQGQGYGLGEWNLVTQGGASVCHVSLTNQPLAQMSAWRAFVRGGQRCTDWRVRNLFLWSVRGNRMGLGDRNGRAIADLNEQNSNLYAAGEWTLQRRGGYVPPGPGYPPPSGNRPGQGYGLGEWNLINQASGSVCHVSLTNQLLPQGLYRAFSRGGQRCFDQSARYVALWVVSGNTLVLNDRNNREIAKMGEQGPNEYAGGTYVLRRRRGYD